MKIYEKLVEWLNEEYSSKYGWTFFNSNNVENDTLGVNSISSSREETEYIDGSKDVSVLFSIVLFKHYDKGTSDINLEAIAEAQSINDWVEVKNAEGDYPTLAENITVNEIKCLESTPSVTVDSEAGVAKYQTQFHINYFEKGERK